GRRAAPVLDGRFLARELPEDSRARFHGPGPQVPAPQAGGGDALGRPAALLRDRPDGLRRDGDAHVLDVRGPLPPLAKLPPGRGLSLAGAAAPRPRARGVRVGAGQGPGLPARVREEVAARTLDAGLPGARPPAAAEGL